MPQLINLNFMHPKYGTTININIDSTFSIREVLNQLLLSGFVRKEDGHYSLELMGKALDEATIIGSIPDLYDGVVIRIVEHLPQQVIAPTAIQLYCLHPDNALPFVVHCPSTTPCKELLVQALQKGFLIGNLEDYQIAKGGIVLDVEKSLNEQHIQEGDYLYFQRLVVEEDVKEGQEAEVAAPTTALDDLKKQLDELAYSLQPQPHSHGQLLPNTEGLPYETLETVVARLRERSKAPNIPPLKLKSTPIAVYVLLVVVLLIGLVAIGIFALS